VCSCKNCSTLYLIFEGYREFQETVSRASATKSSYYSLQDQSVSSEGKRKRNVVQAAAMGKPNPLPNEYSAEELAEILFRYAQTVLSSGFSNRAYTHFVPSSNFASSFEGGLSWRLGGNCFCICMSLQCMYEYPWFVGACAVAR